MGPLGLSLGSGCIVADSYMTPRSCTSGRLFDRVPVAMRSISIEEQQSPAFGMMMLAQIADHDLRARYANRTGASH
jgi:hypothetical protein